MNLSYVGDGRVTLIAGGGRYYSEMAAKFCRTEKEVDDIIASKYVKGLLKDLIHSGHTAALEFDNFIFGVQGYARVTETQLVRKRHASYMIKSGRNNKDGKRSFDVVIPHDIENIHAKVQLDPKRIEVALFPYPLDNQGDIVHVTVERMAEDLRDIYFPTVDDMKPIVSMASADLYTTDILEFIEQWYASGVNAGVPEEDLRYLKPQATEFKAAILMNGSALRDFFLRRLCLRAQTEIRDLANKMYQAGLEVAPDLFEEFGPPCKLSGYCSESEQCEERKGKIPTKDEVMKLIQNYYHK